MNLVDYGILLSKNLRKLPESKELLEGWDNIQKRYKATYGDDRPQPLNIFMNLLEQQCNKYNFAGWDVSLQICSDNLENPTKDIPPFLLDDLRILVEDTLLADYVSKMTDFAKKMHDFFQVIPGNPDINEINGIANTHKLRYSIKDLGIAVDRAGFRNLVLSFAQKHIKQGELKFGELNTEYDNKRHQLNVLPYSDEYLSLRKEYSLLGLDPHYIDLGERFKLFQHVVQKAIFNGFWGGIAELDTSHLELWPSSIPEKTISYVTFINHDIGKEMKRNKSWLYKVFTDNNPYYVFIESKTISYNQDSGAKSELMGFIYPHSDVDFFNGESIFDYTD